MLVIFWQKNSCLFVLIEEVKEEEEEHEFILWFLIHPLLSQVQMRYTVKQNNYGKLFRILAAYWWIHSSCFVRQHAVS